jgi:hypothetical protein
MQSQAREEEQQSKQSTSAPYRFIPLEEKSTDTAELLQEIGGGQAILRMVDRFYQHMFEDQHLDQFVLNHNDPHFLRLGNWIIEKMGGEGNVWSDELKVRSRCPVVVNLPMVGKHIVHDRTSAHVAAWHCPKRSPSVLGNHFKLHDCRVWMRLMFWSARETHLFDNSTFESWFTRFIADYIPVYEQTAVYFVRESARWSLDSKNMESYLARENRMEEGVLGPDGRGVPFREALKSLPREEATDRYWPHNVNE